MKLHVSPLYIKEACDTVDVCGPLNLSTTVQSCVHVFCGLTFLPCDLQVLLEY